MSRISEHISSDEYKCKHCGALPPSWKGGAIPSVHEQFFLDWEEIRSEWGNPITIKSGYRCPAHNKAAGGEQLSVHMFGLALDFAPSRREDLMKLYRLTVKLHPEWRIGLYEKKGFIHGDVGYSIDPIASSSWKEGARWNK